MMSLVAYICGLLRKLVQISAFHLSNLRKTFVCVQEPWETKSLCNTFNFAQNNLLKKNIGQPPYVSLPCLKRLNSDSKYVVFSASSYKSMTCWINENLKHRSHSHAELHLIAVENGTLWKWIKVWHLCFFAPNNLYLGQRQEVSHLRPKPFNSCPRKYKKLNFHASSFFHRKMWSSTWTSKSIT